MIAGGTPNWFGSSLDSCFIETLTSILHKRHEKTFFFLRLVLRTWGCGKNYDPYIIGEFFSEIFNIFGDGGPATHKKKLEMIAHASAINSVQKSSKSELSSRIFGRLIVFRIFSLLWSANHLNKNMKQLNLQLHILNKHTKPLPKKNVCFFYVEQKLFSKSLFWKRVTFLKAFFWKRVLRNVLKDLVEHFVKTFLQSKLCF